MRQLLQRLLLASVFAVPIYAIADYNATQGVGTIFRAFDATHGGSGACAAANTQCAGSVPMDATGTAIPALNVGVKGTPGTDFLTTQGGQGSATAKGLAITTGGTSQTLIAANASRAGMMIQNPCSAAEQGIGAAEDLILNLTNAATLTTNVNWVVLAPCASIAMGLNGGLVTTEAVTAITTTTAHVVYAKEF